MDIGIATFKLQRISSRSACSWVVLSFFWFSPRKLGKILILTYIFSNGLVDWILDFTTNFSCFSGLEILESPDLHNPTLLKGIYQRWPQSGPYERKKPVLELLEADVSCVFFRCDWCWSVTPGSRKSLDKKNGKNYEEKRKFGKIQSSALGRCDVLSSKKHHKKQILA